MSADQPPASSVLAVRRELKTRFEGYLDAAGITECPVFLGHPGQVVPLRFVTVGTTGEHGTKRDIRRLPHGRGSIGETYSLTIEFWQEAPGEYDVEAQAGCTEMVWAIATALDAGLRSQMSEWRLEQGGVALVTQTYFDAFDDQEYLLAEGRAASIEASLHVDSAKQ